MFLVILENCFINLDFNSRKYNLCNFDNFYSYLLLKSEKPSFKMIGCTFQIFQYFLRIESCLYVCLCFINNISNIKSLNLIDIKSQRLVIIIFKAVNLFRRILHFYNFQRQENNILYKLILKHNFQPPCISTLRVSCAIFCTKLASRLWKSLSKKSWPRVWWWVKRTKSNRPVSISPKSVLCKILASFRG